MGPGEWIALAGLILFWSATLITFWIQIKIKLTELDLKIKTLETNLETHERWGREQQTKNLTKFSNIQMELKDNYKELVNKLDVLIDRFADFRVYLEKKTKD